MEQNTFKKTLKLASNILLIAKLVLMVFALRMEHYYLAVATIASSAVSIVITALGHEKIEDAANNAVAGKSAYEIAKENGYTGTEAEFGKGLALVASVAVYEGETEDIA
jgi:hypothetical protein